MVLIFIDLNDGAYVRLMVCMQGVQVASHMAPMPWASCIFGGRSHMVSATCDRGCMCIYVLMCVLCMRVYLKHAVGKFDLGGVLSYIIHII